MPVLRRELTRDDRRPGVAAVIEDLKHIATLLIAERGEAPIVEDEDVDPGQLDQQADVGAIGVRKPQGVKEPREPPIARSIAMPAGLVGQRTGQKALADAGGPDDQDGLVLGDPAARRELADETPIKAPARGVIEGFETGVGRLELGLCQGVRHPAILPRQPFRIDQ